MAGFWDFIAGALIFAPAALAQGPGAGLVGNGPVVPSLSVSTLVGTDTGVEDPLYTGDYGPWSSVEYLEGTWTSKSGTVVTGPAFYDPIDELLVEPGLPGISYSFTKDGFWEQAIYQVNANGTDPKCATAALIFQHGTYSLKTDGSLELTPFRPDGRLLTSDPCGRSRDESTYEHYAQSEKFSKFAVYIDLYHGRYRLDMYRFDGSPMPPMYLAYKPPQMLPTSTMNPTNGGKALNGLDQTTAAGDSDKSSTGTGRASATPDANSGDGSSLRKRVRRSLINRSRTKATKVTQPRGIYDTALWWTGVGLMAAGAAGWVALG